MEWGRVKSIMIGIFCLVNIFLFLSYMDQTGTSVKISEESVQNTAVVLSNNNVYIDHKLIPRKLQDIRIFDAVNKYETPDAASKAFWEIAQSLGIDLFNPQKTVTDECIFEYKTYDDPQAYNLTESTALAYAKKIVSQLNLDFGMRLGSELSLSNDVFTVTYHQEYEGLKVLDTCLVIELANGGYTRIYGKTGFVTKFRRRYVINPPCHRNARQLCGKLSARIGGCNFRHTFGIFYRQQARQTNHRHCRTHVGNYNK